MNLKHLKEILFLALLLPLIIGAHPLTSSSDEQDDSSKTEEESKQVEGSPKTKLEEVIVVGKRGQGDDELVGSYAQPRWTTTPRFPTTSVYVVPEGTLEVDIWNDWEWEFDIEDEKEEEEEEGEIEEEQKGPTMSHTIEIEVGIGHRIQLDFYLGFEKVDWDGAIYISEQGFELRYALANWGKIWGNPAIYLDYVNKNEKTPEFEVKLLLGGNLAPKWHCGSNLTYEREFKSQDAEQEVIYTFAVSRTIVDQKFSFGIELKTFLEQEFEVEYENGKEEKEMENEWGALAGPSLQWKPIPDAYINLVTLFGAKSEEDEYKAIANPILLVGLEF